MIYNHTFFQFVKAPNQGWAMSCRTVQVLLFAGEVVELRQWQQVEQKHGDDIKSVQRCRIKNWMTTKVRCWTAGPWNCQATVGRPQWAENSTSESHMERKSVRTYWNCTASACIVFHELWCKLVLAVERLLLEYRQDSSGYGTTSWLCCRLVVVKEISSLDSVA